MGGGVRVKKEKWIKGEKVPLLPVSFYHSFPFFLVGRKGEGVETPKFVALLIKCRRWTDRQWTAAMLSNLRYAANRDTIHAEIVIMTYTYYFVIPLYKL